MMTTEQDRINAIRARANVAHPGPWNTQRSMDPSQDDLTMYVVDERQFLTIDFGYVGNRPENDAEFVAHARADIPFLLDQLEQARAERDEARRDQTAECQATDDALARTWAERDRARNTAVALEQALAAARFEVEPARTMARNAIANAVQDATEDFQPLSVRYQIAGAVIDALQQLSQEP